MPPTDDAKTYLTGLIDQLGAAVRDGDTAAVDRVLDKMDADGHVRAAAVLTRAVARTRLGPALAEPPMDTMTDTVMSDAMRLAVERLVAVSRWVNAWPANAARDQEALTWVRVAKVASEAGEAVTALDLAGGGNPRKPRGPLGQVEKELLDTAVAALGAYEHLTGHMGFSLAALFGQIEGVHERAGLDSAELG